MTTRLLYLHGIASGPDSPKGLAVEAHLAKAGIAVERLDLRTPSAEQLRVSAMIGHVRERIGAADAPVVLMGSSLGALTACRVAEVDRRVTALVLLAPAIRCAARWREKVGASGVAAWEQTGWLTADFPGGRKGRLDFGFLRDVSEIDARDEGLPDVRVPALVIHGRSDTVVDIALARGWTQGKSHIRLLEVEDGHELKSSIGVVLEETSKFLRDVSASTG
jgi:pimeloyl-ACP methyl ester carboxylesterase